MNKFTGSYAEFGEYLAKKLAERNHDFDTRVNKLTLNKQLKIYKKYWPELLEESKAVAHLLNMPEDEILYDEIASTIDNQKRHVKNAHDSKTDACTIFAIKENGKTFVGRNYDWDPSARNYFQNYNLKIGNSYRYFAFSDEGTYPRHYGRRTWKLYTEDAICSCDTGIASDAGIDTKLIGILRRPVRTLHSDLCLSGRNDADRGCFVRLRSSSEENYEERSRYI